MFGTVDIIWLLICVLCVHVLVCSYNNKPAYLHKTCIVKRVASEAQIIITNSAVSLSYSAVFSSLF